MSDERYFAEHADEIAQAVGIPAAVDSKQTRAGREVPSPSDPLQVARAFIADVYLGAGGVPLLRHHRNTFYRYVGSHWPEDDEHRVQSELWQWLEGAVYWKTTKKNEPPELVPFEPTKYKIANVLEALKAIGHIAAAIQPPVWLAADGTPLNIAGELVPLENGLLDLETRELREHTPGFFYGHVLPFPFHPRAPRPTRWLRFLDELWAGDPESKATLGEWFGYVLAGATDLQKMVLLVGPKRSGKGTIARVLTGLLGTHNTSAPTLAGLTQNFGLQPLIGKPLAVVSDARLAARSDNMVAVERLLSISGEDIITVDRKYRDPWTGQLPTRFMILTNELPRFSDSSGALASRFISLILTTSFYGQENPRLTAELLAEAPAIFNWALEGLDRLRGRGYFVTPGSSKEMQQNLEDLASPVGAFLRERCVVDPAYEVAKDVLWEAWKDWCLDEGRSRPGTKAVFARDLHAAVPFLVSARPRGGDRRWHTWRGLLLKEQWAGPLTTPDQQDPGLSGQRSDDTQIPLNHAGGQGWSGVESTVVPAFDDKQQGLRLGDPGYPMQLDAAYAAGQITADELQAMLALNSLARQAR